MAARDGERLLLSQPLGHRFGAGLLQGGHQGVLVQIGGIGGKRHARRRQQGLAAFAARSQDQAHPMASLRSANRFITAAAVSSMERRETSMVGQSWLSNNWRVAAI